MVKRVLTGVDHTDAARNAAEKAAALAVAFGAELHVLTAYRLDAAATMRLHRSTNASDVAATIESQGEADSRRIKDAEEIAASVADELRKHFPHVSITAETAEGEPAQAIVERADRLDADIVVIGNKRVQGIGRILGNIARDVAKDIKCDLYVAYTYER